jgi:hypothetical protein
MTFQAPQCLDAVLVRDRLHAMTRPDYPLTLEEARAMLAACEVAFIVSDAARLQHAFDVRERCAQLADPTVERTPGPIAPWRAFRAQLAADIRALRIDEDGG